MQPSSDFQNFPGPASEFQDFPGLENDFLKFQDFQGPVRTLVRSTVELTKQWYQCDHCHLTVNFMVSPLWVALSSQFHWVVSAALPHPQNPLLRPFLASPLTLPAITMLETHKKKLLASNFLPKSLIIKIEKKKIFRSLQNFWPF